MTLEKKLIFKLLFLEPNKIVETKSLQNILSSSQTPTSSLGNVPQQTSTPISFGNMASVISKGNASPAKSGTTFAFGATSPSVVFGSKNLPGFGDLAKTTVNGENKASPFSTNVVPQLSLSSTFEAKPVQDSTTSPSLFALLKNS